MSCPKKQHLLAEYFAENLPPLSRDEIDRHLHNCEECAAELEALIDTQRKISLWQDERLPHWDRGTTLFQKEHGNPQKSRRVGGWQWLPTGISFAMLCLLVFNLTIDSDEAGFTLRFGGNSPSVEDVQLEQRLAEFAVFQQQAQEQVLQAFMSRADERQDSNNLRLVQLVLDQTQEMTAENFDQMYSYFEQQRQLDMENVQVSYQQLVDSDYDTLQSMQQLANFVRVQGEPR